jgi:hypothetical protein
VQHVLAMLENFTEVPAKPFVLTVGAHALALEQMRRVIDELPAWISACYLLVTPTDLRAVSATRLEALIDVYQHANAQGFQVVVGRGGTIIAPLRAVGVCAGDAGLGTGETFDQSPERRGQRPSSSVEKRSGGPRSRIYLRQIDRSVDAGEARRLLAVRGVAEELQTCRLPCHRFQAGDLLAHAREHSLWTRVDEARRISLIPEAGRIDALRDELRQRRSTLTRINDALISANEAPLDTTALDNKLTWLNRAAAHSAAA